MCRILLAQGIFSPEIVLDQAIAMSEGRPGMQGFSPVPNHLDGCGIIWKDPLSGEIRCHRELGPLSRAKYIFLRLLPAGVSFLAIHSRSASVASTKILRYTHPLQTNAQAQVQWAFMHNGFLPTAYLQLGRNQPEFDTQEYFDYIIPPQGTVLDGAKVLSQLEALLARDPQDLRRQCSAANAVIVNKERFYVVNWAIDVEHPIGVGCIKNPRNNPYYMLHGCQYSGAMYIASEALPLLTPGQAWERLSFQSVHEFIFIPGWPPRVKAGVKAISL